MSAHESAAITAAALLAMAWPSLRLRSSLLVHRARGGWPEWFSPPTGGENHPEPT